MEKLAAKQPGFLGLETARDKIGITVSYWCLLEAIDQWRNHLEHKKAKDLGVTAVVQTLQPKNLSGNSINHLFYRIGQNSIIVIWISGNFFAYPGRKINFFSFAFEFNFC